MNLAKQATALTSVKEIRIEANSAAAKTSPKPITIVTPPILPIDMNLSAVFQDKKDMVDPVKEREFLMKIKAMEESETECATNIEKPMLGKVSLVRRAKSAVSRSIIERRINDKHPLFTAANEKENAGGRSGDCAIDIGGDENGSDDDLPTADEVKRHMELFHLRRGQPLASDKMCDSRKSKHSKSRSARGSKSNRYTFRFSGIFVCFLVFLVIFWHFCGFSVICIEFSGIFVDFLLFSMIFRILHRFFWHYRGFFAIFLDSSSFSLIFHNFR